MNFNSKSYAMRSRFFFCVMMILMSFSYSFSNNTNVEPLNTVKVSLDLINVQDDKVSVTVTAPEAKSEEVIYQFPRIIPGTYAIADYGRYIASLKATDDKGNELSVKRKDVNTFVINNAMHLRSITYLVNDTYDSEKGNAFDSKSKTIFSPAGTNILAGKNFMLNMCGFVGYFSGYKDVPYQITIEHPENLLASSALTDEDAGTTTDRFNIERYADVVDNPIMYAEPDTASFKVNGMEVLISVYSPNNKNISAKAFLPDIEHMVTAQKRFMGDINKTKKYAILAYISSASANDAKGFGALEHNFSTTAIFGESMKTEELVHVIAHEFFHTLTPLNVHSKEIHDFDFNAPKMSAHLWMYEGITEYFSQLFQVNQGLMTEEQFYKIMAGNEAFSKRVYKDNLSFTEMSKNVLNPAYKDQYPNVYKKGALLAMCLDIIIRSNTNGTTGVLDLMGQLSKIYGPSKPFDDDELIPKVTELSNKEVGDFIQKHIVDGKPVKYSKYLKRMGVKSGTVQKPEEFVFIVNKQPYIRIDTSARIVKVTGTDNNNFFTELGVRTNDELLELNGVPFDAANFVSVIMMGMGLKEGSPAVLKVKRGERIVELKGKVKLNYKNAPGYIFKDNSKLALKNAWLKG